MFHLLRKFKLHSNPFFILVTFLSLNLLSPSAHAEGLTKAKGVLELIKTELLGIVPVIAAIALVGMGIGYAMNSIQKETFIKWAVGLIVAGSAAQITTMLFN